MTTLQTLERHPAGDAPPDAAIIWLHGLGATAHDFEGIPPELGLPDSLRVRYVFPQAPSRPVTINGGMHMPAWYDILSLDGSQRGQDVEGIRTSQRQVSELIQREVERGVPEERIVLAGFSQGGAIALHTGLRHPRRLAGIMALSAYLLLPDDLEREASDANTNLSIFQAHGTFDPVVRHEWAVDSREVLRRHGYAVEWHDYRMMHQVCLEEIRDIGLWLQSVLI